MSESEHLAALRAAEKDAEEVRFQDNKARSLATLRNNITAYEDPLEAAWCLGYGRGYNDGWDAAPDGW